MNNKKNKKINDKAKKRDIFHWSTSSESMRENRTGSWRYLAPSVELKTSPCEAACPLAIPISDFILQVERGNLEEAAQIIRHESPFPTVCGRVCIHPCEYKCNRIKQDRSIAIHMLERFVGDHGSAPHLKPVDSSKKQVAIVGAGPAGLAAAYFLGILGYKTTIFEARDEPGGILRYGIPDYRMPVNILQQAVENALCYKPTLKTGTALGDNLSLDELDLFDAVFFSTGAAFGKTPGTALGQASGTVTGVELLGMIKREDYDSIGNRITIIGGGNTAIDVARSLLRLGRRPVILYRREIEDMPAFGKEVREALREGVDIKTGVVVDEIIEADGGVVGVRCSRVTFDRNSQDNRNTFNTLADSEFYLETDQVISAIGESPDLSILPGDLKQEEGKVAVDRFGRAGSKRFFAGGDLVNQPHLVVHALASGKRAAVSIDAMFSDFIIEEVDKAIVIADNGISFKRYLEVRQQLKSGIKVIVPSPGQVCGFDEINLDYFDDQERVRERKLSIGERANSFKEVHVGYGDDGAVSEAGRCYHCGHCILCDNCLIYCPDVSIRVDKQQKCVVVDYEYCKGCGLCAVECPRGVIKMEREVVK